MRLSAALLCALCGFALGTGPVQSGAWLRGAGQGFVASAATYRWDASTGAQGRSFSLYAEYGWRADRTIGFDGYHDGAGGSHGMVFMRRALNPSDRRTRIALDLGIGVAAAGSRLAPIGRVTIGIGRGFATARGNGWASMDAALEWRQGAPDLIWKLDATIGLRRSEPLLLMLSAESALIGGRFSYALIPTMGYKPGPRAPTLLAGLELRSAHTRSIGLKLSLWRDF